MAKAFFHGIKGVGMTALALAMQDDGWQVEGSDSNDSFITDQVLVKRKILVHPGLQTCIPGNTDLVVYSGAYTKPATPIRTLALAEALAEFVADRRVIAVAGVGGKTTISAMLAKLFRAAGRDVGYYVGTGSIAGLLTPGAAGSDPWFVVEADEYAISTTNRHPKFTLLNPEILITTHLLHDHPDLYPDQQATLAAYASLLSRLPPTATWLYLPDDLLTKRLLATSPSCRLIPYSLPSPSLSLSVFGEHNQLDAQAAIQAAELTGLDSSLARQAVATYHGCGRRQEFHGEIAGRLLYDDYAHHPHELTATLTAFRSRFPSRRLLAVFEPHTYSRTLALLPQFATALTLADLVFVMPIFPSAREKKSAFPITSAALAKLIPQAVSLTWKNASSRVWQVSQSGDLILTMGAGFVYKLHNKFKTYES